MTQIKQSRLILALIALMTAFVMALSACGANPSQNTEPAANPSAAEQTAQPQAQDENKGENKETSEASDKKAEGEIILASTTSTQDSGLFDVLIPAFEQDHPGLKVSVVAVGTGQAIKMGESKDADALLVHAKDSEEKFVKDGFGTERQDVMYNDFVIVGPKDDRAGIKGSANAAEAFAKLAETNSTFYSRGDDSGTHKKEMKIWDKSSAKPEGEFYQVTGQGMGDTLKIADEKQSYTFTDRATYLSLKKEGAINLEICYEGSDDLLNQYGVIPVKDAKNQAGGEVFAEWITSDKGQQVIKEYGVKEYGQPLFFPNAK